MQKICTGKKFSDLVLHTVVFGNNTHNPWMSMSMHTKNIIINKIWNYAGYNVQEMTLRSIFPSFPPETRI